MRIGFDISQTGKLKAGCGYFADGLIRNLSELDTTNEYILYSTFGDFYWDENHHELCHIKQANFKYGLKHSNLETSQNFWRHPPTDIREQLDFPDILHANNFFCPAKIDNTKLVYTLYDLSFIEHPEWSTEQNRLGCFEGFFNASLNADFIIAISEYSKKHFLETFPHYNAERISVAYPACRFINSSKVNKPKRFNQLQPDRFWLTVGTIEPRKNHKSLLHAYAQLKQQQKQVMPLVLAGGNGWMMDDFHNLLKELNIVDDVQLVGYVNDMELTWLYQNCYCVLYPSLFEGFGLPVLEAMTLGAPVITSNVSSIPEIVGTACILIDPYQNEEITQAMIHILEDNAHRQELKVNAVLQAKKFSWKESAKKILNIYQQLL